MKTNISTLMNLIAEEEKQLANMTYNIKSLAFTTTIEELDGRVNIIEDNKASFDEKLAKIEKIVAELSKLKALLYEKNNTFKLTDGRTIQQAIVDNSNLRKLKTTYEDLLLKRNSKSRVTEVNNSYFECNKINYDLEQIKNKLDKVLEKIQRTDFEISKLNSIEFEI